MRIATGLWKPNSGVPGFDLAGRVEAVGKNQNLRRYLSVPKHEDLVVLKALAESGKLRPVIDRRFSLAETADALRHIEGGHARGKIVVTV